jgi:type IV pilus assembly protein PilQ
MEKYLFKILSVFIIVLWLFTYAPIASLAAETTDESKATDNNAQAVAAKVGYLENVLWEKSSGKERINLVVSQQPAINIESQTNGKLLVKLENMLAPENLRRPLGEGELNNIISVTPSQQLIEGKQWIYLTIAIKELVPYAIKQEGQNVLIDFNVSSLVKKTPKRVVAKVSAEPAKRSNDVAEIEASKAKPIQKETFKRYTNRLISLDFQDSDIRSVLRLMGEYGNISIVSGDDVKGNVTLSMKNVPWEQALDTILDINGLAKKQMGDVISVMTLERKKKDEADKVKAEEDQRKAEDARKERDTKLLAEKGLLQQILIEAKIVEATEVFIRNIGINWGFGGAQSIGAYGSRVAGGTNTLQNNSWASPYPSEITSTDSTGNPLHMAAVNLASAIASPTFGVVIGAGTAFLEAQLAALESTTTGKIISAPKVVTMDGVKATIKQGDEVPYVTPGALGSPPTVSFKEALLRLDVKPKITAEGKISMEIKATNDVPDYAQAVNLQGNPPIRKNEVESTVVINNGDTIVIGGITRTQDDFTVSGLPWLQKIPVLGWLFKTENIKNQKRQLLIFVTPKILKSGNFAESPEKIIN